MAGWGTGARGFPGRGKPGPRQEKAQQTWQVWCHLAPAVSAASEPSESIGPAPKWREGTGRADGSSRAGWEHRRAQGIPLLSSRKAGVEAGRLNTPAVGPDSRCRRALARTPSVVNLHREQSGQESSKLPFPGSPDPLTARRLPFSKQVPLHTKLSIPGRLMPNRWQMSAGSEGAGPRGPP